MMYALWYKFEDESGWEQLDLFDSPKVDWIGPLFWPTLGSQNKISPEVAITDFCESLPGRKVKAEIRGFYERKGEKWQLIPLN